MVDGRQFDRTNRLAYGIEVCYSPREGDCEERCWSDRPSQTPHPEWQPSYRYFRLSQTTPDLFDAYRDAYLALESVLSDLAPQQAGERDRDWFLRALRATGVVLQQYISQAGPASAEETLYQELYVSLRTTVFHAKTNRPTLLPRHEPDRKLVLAGLKRLRDLYLAIVERHHRMRRLTGVIFPLGAQVMLSPIFDHLRVFVTSDESPVDVSTPIAGTPSHPSMELRMEPPDYAQRSATRLARVSLADLHSLPFVRRAQGADGDDEVRMTTVLEGRLVLPQTGQLEVLLGAAIVSAGGMPPDYE